MPTLHIRILDVHHQSATALPRVHYSKGPTIQPCRDAVRHMYLFDDSCAASAAAPISACGGGGVGRASTLGADRGWQINEDPTRARWFAAASPDGSLRGGNICAAFAPAGSAGVQNVRSMV